MDARKKILSLMLCALSMAAICMVLLVAADLYYHNKYLSNAGLNYRGYRGEVLGKKKADEIRVAVLGSSIVFGYGLKYYEALPAQLEKSLTPYSDKKITVINLAYNAEGVYAFYYNLSDFSYLDYDYVVLYSGELDLAAGKITTYRHSDPVFRAFGYMPILPLIIKEKIMLIRSNGNLDKAYREQKVVFKPGAGDKAANAAFEKALDTEENIESVIARLGMVKGLDFSVDKLRTDRWAWYIYYSLKAIDFALQHKKKVIVISPPSHNERNRDQQEALRKVLPKEVFYSNLAGSASLNDSDLFYDGAHLTAKGSKVMADIMAQKIGPYIRANEAQVK